MPVLAHVGGLPLEEALFSLGSAGSCLLVARVWLQRVFRRHSVSSAASSQAASSSSRSEASAARSAWSSRSRP